MLGLRYFSCDRCGLVHADVDDPEGCGRCGGDLSPLEGERERGGSAGGAAYFAGSMLDGR